MSQPRKDFGPALEERDLLLYSEAICASLAKEAPMLGEEPLRFDYRALQAPKLNESLNFQQKLGYIYEDAAAACIEQSPRFELIARNLQVITPEKQTLGELDFVVMDRETRQHIHLEVAIKFYLAEAAEGGFHFPGPDKRDNYQRKLERLSDHQMQLSMNPHTRALLQQLFDIDTIVSQQLVHGIFYDHYRASEHPLPDGASPAVRRRPWMFLNEFLSEHPDLSSCQLVHKALWPCELDAGSLLQQYLPKISRETLIDLASQRCTLVLATPDSPPTFVAPNDW